MSAIYAGRKTGEGRRYRRGPAGNNSLLTVGFRVLQDEWVSEWLLETAACPYLAPTLSVSDDNVDGNILHRKVEEKRVEPINPPSTEQLSLWLQIHTNETERERERDEFVGEALVNIVIMLTLFFWQALKAVCQTSAQF